MRPGQRTNVAAMGATTTLGPELVTDGSFASGATSWVLTGAVTVAGGKASFAAGGALNRVAQTLAGGAPPAGTYRLTFTVADFVTAAPGAVVRLASGASVSLPITGAGPYSIDIVSVGTGAGVRVEDPNGVGVFSATAISGKSVS
jgi:hypothetical protein